MKVQVKLFATLVKYLPAGAQNRMTELDVPEGTTAGLVLEQLGIPKTLAHLTMVNGAHTPWDHPLQDGDQISVFPPVAGGCIGVD